ncbi:MAG: hypothetical protein ACREV4_01770 [Gammaproteobacteria bacterium]
MNDSDRANILVIADLPENQLVYRTVLEELGLGRRYPVAATCLLGTI